MNRLSLIAAALLCLPCPGPAQTPPVLAPQNPSPMVERSRKHERLAPRDLEGIRRTFDGPQNKPVHIFASPGARGKASLHLVVHFLGSPFVPELAVSQLGSDYVLAVVSIGAGSNTFDRAFADPGVYDTLLSNIKRDVSIITGVPAAFRTVTLSGFSAGHGAIRAILRDSAHFASVDAVLLLDGMHTSYVPQGLVMEKGGTLDESVLDVFARFGREAIAGRRRFVVTHSEIFPGTFASTTETADWLIAKLGLSRRSVLEWGPRGMQQISEVKQGRLAILAFAGNSAPDHVDHMQGMPEFLRLLLK